MDEAALPAGWRLWNEEPGGRVILAFRPDVFDGDRLPEACLPTIYLTNGSRRARPGAGGRETDEWHVVLYLEPEVEMRAAAETHDDRDRAVAAALDLAERFAAGRVDYREPYQVPREAYFERLDDVVGDDPDD